MMAISGTVIAAGMTILLAGMISMAAAGGINESASLALPLAAAVCCAGASVEAWGLRSSYREARAAGITVYLVHTHSIPYVIIFVGLLMSLAWLAVEHADTDASETVVLFLLRLTYAMLLVMLSVAAGIFMGRDATSCEKKLEDYRNAS